MINHNIASLYIKRANVSSFNILYKRNKFSAGTYTIEVKAVKILRPKPYSETAIYPNYFTEITFCVSISPLADNIRKYKPDDSSVSSTI
jgi:hypothetical protein